MSVDTADLAVVCRLPLRGAISGRISPGGPSASRLVVGDPGLGRGTLAAILASGSTVGVCGVPIRSAHAAALALVRDGTVPLSSSDSRCTAPAPCQDAHVSEIGTAGRGAEVQAVAGSIGAGGAVVAASSDSDGGLALWRGTLSQDGDDASPLTWRGASESRGWISGSDGFGHSFTSVAVPSAASASPGAPLCAVATHYEGKRACLVRAGEAGSLETVAAWAVADSPMACALASSDPEEAAAGRCGVLVAEGACVSLYDARVGERGGRVARAPAMPAGSGERVVSLDCDGGLVLVGGSGSIVRVLDPRTLRSVGRWQSPAKAGLRGVCLAGAPWRSVGAKGASGGRGLAFGVGGDCDAFSGLYDLAAPPEELSMRLSAAEAGVSSRPHGGDGGSSGAKRPRADEEEDADEDGDGDGDAASSAPAAAGDGAASGQLRQERKPVGSGPPGGSTGRLGLRQSSGYRAAAAWAGLAAPAVQHWAPEAAPGALRRVLVTLGDDGALWAVPDASSMLPDALRASA